MKRKPFIRSLLFTPILSLLSLPYMNSSIYNVNPDVVDSTSSYVQNQLIVTFQEETSLENVQSLVHQICPSASILEYEDGFCLLDLSTPEDLTDTANSFAACPEVITAEPNYLISSMQISKDAYSNTQWALENTGSYRSYNHGSGKKTSSTQGVDLNIAPAWLVYNMKKGAQNEVVVAIIDTGVDVDHEDLSQNIWVNPGEIPDDGIDNDGNGYIDDINGWDFYNNDATLYSSVYDSSTNTNSSDPEDNDDHGTHCAGIIGAVSNNKIGIAGVASNINVKIMPLKIEGGAKGNGTISDAIKAIKYAEKMGAKVCNISWGSGLNSSSLEQAIRESSMLFVAAAGNTGTNNNSSPVYPASYDLDNIISVTFIDADGTLTALSNYGSKTVDLAAPGYDILSTTVGNSYGVMSGSSMAVPHVSALAAMAYASDSHLYPSNVRKLILNHTTSLSELKGKVIHAGIPNAKVLVTSLNKLKQDKKKPSLSCETKYSGSDLIVVPNASDTGGSGVRVVKYLYGKQSLSSFEHGTVGTTVTENQIALSKAGTYTFYTSDYAGNEKIKVYKVLDDKTPPTITSSYTVADNYKKITITAHISDKESGIKYIKYMEGKHTAEDFKAVNAGTKVEATKEKVKIKVTKAGTYTIYAVDYRGNKSVHIVDAKIVKATGILLTIPSKTITQGNTYELQPFIKPTDSTDQLTYKSSDTSILTVSTDGIVTALSKGQAIVTVSTSSGQRASITLTVE